eukprot:253109_1
MAKYGLVSYWDERYQTDPEPFDWLQHFPGLSNIISDHVSKDHSILMVGAGNSRLSEEMLEDGYLAVTNIDASSVVIEQMSERYKERPELTWKCMNACAIEFPDKSFDVAIDKGTMDSILCGEGSVTNVAKLCQEISRVLKRNGVYIVVSYGQPDTRLGYLENSAYLWKVEVFKVPKPTINPTLESQKNDPSSFHYIYVCKKEVTTMAG